MDLGAGVRRVTLGALAASSFLVGIGATPAKAQTTQKPNIMFIMADDIGWMQVQALRNGTWQRRDPEHRSHRQRRHASFTDYLRHAELHLRAHMPSSPACIRLRTGMIPPQLPGQPVVCCGPARQRSRRSSSTTSATPPAQFGKNHLGDHDCVSTDSPRLPGVLGLALSPGRYAAGELPRHQQQADCVQAVAPPCKNTPVPRTVRPVPGLVDPKSGVVCFTPPRPIIGCHIVRRLAGEPSLQGRGPTDARSVGDGG